MEHQNVISEHLQLPKLFLNDPIVAGKERHQQVKIDLLLYFFGKIKFQRIESFGIH